MIAFYTLLYREIVRIFRIWTQTLLPPVITTALYFLIFGKVIGGKVGTVQGVQYVQYILPGLIAMTVINNAFSNVVASFFSAKFQRNIEEMLIAPMSIHTMLVAFSLGGIIRGCLLGGLVYLISVLFTGTFYVAHFWLMWLVLIATSCLFALVGLVNGVIAKTFDDTAFISSFVLSPLTYLGGVFYSIHSLPNWLAIITKYNPIFYIVNACRYATLGVADVGIEIALTSLLAFIVAAYSLNWYLIERTNFIKE